MKKLSILFCAFASTFSFAQTTITHNTDTTTILTPHAVTCGQQGSYTGHNVFSRSFVLSDFGITEDFNVTNVGFGVENITGELPFTIKLSTTDDMFPWGNLTELSSELMNIGVADALTILDYAYSTPVTVPAGSELVMSFEADGESTFVSWYPASNDGGESAPTYITAEACSILDPTAMADIGFGDVHVIMTVTGETSMGTVELNSRSLTVYPNPATDMVNVSLKNGEIAGNIEISNLAGQNVLSAKSTNSVNVSFLPAGVYVVKVTDSKGVTHMNKIVKK